MSEENYQLKSLHPLKVASGIPFENKKCNLIASHCGILVTVEEKNLKFFSTKAYEETSINSKLRGDKIIDLEPIITLKLQYKSIWIDFNCDGSLLAVVMVTDTNRAVQIKLYDVSKVINNQNGEMAEFNSYNQSQLNDLKWHPYESMTLSIIIDNTCSLCVVENKTIRCISSKSSSFSISWSPKGKQLSVLMRNPTSGAYFINQYDLTMIEKKSTEINDVRSHFGLTINLIPVDICWISTFIFIIGFRGDADNEKYKVYTCTFSLKKNKIEPLRDIRSSLDCIQEGINARLYNKHLLEWNSIVLVNNTAENLVLYEINADDELKSMATYCFPIDCNVVGMCFDFTSDVRLPPGWINSSTVNTVSHPIIFLQLSNGTCFGIYIINNNKALSKGITKLDIAHIAKHTEEHQDYLKSIAENIKQEKQVIDNNPSQTNIFGIKTQNSKSLFDKNPSATNSSSGPIFGLSNNKPIQPSQSNTTPSIYSQSNATTSNFFEKNPNAENLPSYTPQSGGIFSEQFTNIKPNVGNVESVFKMPIKPQSDIDNKGLFPLKSNSLNQDIKEVTSADKYPQTKFTADTSSKIDSTLSAIDNERDIVDDILSEPLEMLKNQIHNIKQKTKNRIQSSRDLCNSKLLKDVPPMIHTVDTNTNILNKMLSVNEALSKESKSLSDDINLTVEFTSRCKINVQDIKKKKKCVPVTPNPLLTKISKNLEESYNRINGRLYELEEALDYIEREKNSKLNKKQKSIVPQTLYKTMSYNAKIIALEQMKIDLLKKHMDSQNLDDSVDFFPILNKSKKKAKDNEMENQLLSLLSNRMVKQLTSDLININKRAVPSQAVYTPQSSGVIQKPSNESKPPVGNFAPLNVKIVDRNIYKSFPVDNNKYLLSNQTANVAIEASGDRSSCQTNPKHAASFLRNANVNLSSGDTIKNTNTTFQGSGSNNSVFGPDNNQTGNKPQSTANKRTTSSNEGKSPQSLIKSETSSSISSHATHKSPTQQNKAHTSSPIVLKQESEINYSSKESSECMPTETSKISEITNLNTIPTSVTKSKVLSEVSSATTSQTNRVFATYTHEKSQSAGLFNLPSSDIKHVNESTSVTSQDKGLFGQTYAGLKSEGNTINSSNHVTTQIGVSFATTISTTPSIGGLFTSPLSVSISQGLFASSSTTVTQSGGLFVSASKISPLKPSPSKSSPQSSGLFGSSLTATQSSGLFGSSSSSIAQSGGLFGSPSTTTPQIKGLHGSSSTTTPQSGGLFGSSSTTSPQNKGLLGSSSTNAPQNGGLFGTSTTVSQNKGLLGSSSTTSPQSGGLFGSSTTVTQSGSLFGSSTTAQSGGLFGSLSTTSPQSGGLFGSSTTVTQSGSLFGSSSTTTPQSGGLFGSSSTTTPQSGGLFGSSSTTTPQSGELFGSSSTTTPQSGGLFGSSSTTTPQSGGLFGSSSTATPQSGGLFESSSTTAPQSGGLFGSSSTTAPQSGGLFGSSSTTTPQSGGLFGSSSTTTPQSGGLFGSSSTTAPQSGGLFGSSLSTAPQSGGLFGSSSTTTPQSGGLFGSSSTTTPQSGGLFGSSSTTTPHHGGLFGLSSTTTPDTGLFGSSQNSFLSGLGGEAKNQSSNIFGSNTSQSSSSDFGNLFKKNTESSNIFNNSTILTQSPTSSLFGSAPKFGNQDTTAQPSGLFSNSIFGSKQSTNEVSFTNFSSNNNNTPMFDDPVNNQFGNASSNPSFTQRRM